MGQMRGYNELLPRSWINLRQGLDLLASEKPWITFDELETKFSDVVQFSVAVQFLHDTGDKSRS